MAYLVTGGIGYIGSYVVRDLLNAGKEVICLDTSGVTRVFQEVVGEDNLDRVEVIQGDVSDTLQLFSVIKDKSIDLIIHLAYLASPASELKPAYALRINCVGMNNVLEAVRLFGLKRLVWTSSGKALGCVADLYKEPIGNDNAIYRPTTMHGATKALNEHMARLYFNNFGVDSIDFRFTFDYGVGR